jgi:nitrogenase molybdenum-iron protein beta chain
MHGKKFAIYGDPDFLLGLVSFIVEMGGIQTYTPVYESLLYY